MTENGVGKISAPTLWRSAGGGGQDGCPLSALNTERLEKAQT